MFPKQSVEIDLNLSSKFKEIAVMSLIFQTLQKINISSF